MSHVERRAVRTDAAPAAIGPYSQAVCVGTLLFVSGQIPLDPTTGQIVAGDITDQTHRVMQNLGAVLTAAGTDYGHIVRTTIFLTNLDDFALVNDAYGTYFSYPTPARATVQVAALPKGASVEIDAIAHLG